MKRKYLFDEKLLNTFKDVEETPKKEEKVEEIKHDLIETYYEELDKIIDNIKKELGHEDKIDEIISELKEKLTHLSDEENQEEQSEEDKKEVLDDETFSEDEVESLKKLANSGIVDKLLALIKTFDEVDNEEESKESEEVIDDEDKKNEDKEEVLETKAKDSFNSIYFNEVEDNEDDIDEIAKAWSSRIKK